MPANELVFKNAEKARDEIFNKQRLEIAKLYENWAKEIGLKAKGYSKSVTASSVLQEAQMKTLMKELKNAAKQINEEVQGIIERNIYETAYATVKANDEWLKSLGFIPDSSSVAFSSVPNEIVEKLVTGKIYESGWSLSAGIWSDSDKVQSELYKIVAGGLAENKSSYAIAKDLEKYVSPSKKKAWNLKDKDGKRIYPKQVDYNAQRLARTLTQHSYQQSFIETTIKNPFITDYIWNSNGPRVCPICKARDGMSFKKSELPMDHPNGMCVIVPNVSSSLEDDLVSWFNGVEGDYPEIDEFAKEVGYSLRE